ncbi:MAG: hypothetical protein ACLFV7_00630 [Phycisphaerae bacterium]
MLAQIQPDQIFQWLHVGAGIYALLAIILSLLQCFFGYVLFRLTLVIWGIVTGYAIGEMALLHYLRFLRPDPSHMDLVVFGLLCAVLLGLASWFLYRGFAALFVGLWGLSAVLFVLGEHSAGLAWTLGSVTGLALAAVVLVHTRPIIMGFTALTGGTAAVIYGAILMTFEGWLEVWWGIAIVVGVALALAVAGYLFQKRTYRALALGFAPEPKRKGRVSTRGKRPPLSKY